MLCALLADAGCVSNCTLVLVKQVKQVKQSKANRVAAPTPERLYSCTSKASKASQESKAKQAKSSAWGPHAYVSIRQHTSAYVSTRQHTFAAVIVYSYPSKASKLSSCGSAGVDAEEIVLVY